MSFREPPGLIAHPRCLLLHFHPLLEDAGVFTEPRLGDIRRVTSVEELLEVLRQAAADGPVIRPDRRLVVLLETATGEVRRSNDRARSAAKRRAQKYLGMEPPRAG